MSTATGPPAAAKPFRDNERFMEFQQEVNPSDKYQIGFHRSEPQNVFAMLERACRAHPNRKCMTWLDDRGEPQHVWTFGEFFERWVIISAWLCILPPPTPLSATWLTSPARCPSAWAVNYRCRAEFAASRTTSSTATASNATTA